MGGARTVPSVADGIVQDLRLRDTRAVVYEPGNGTRYSLLLVDLDHVPAGTMREMDLPANGILVFWANPLRTPQRKVGTVISATSASHIHPRILGRALGAPPADAMILSELFSYLLDLPLVGVTPYARPSGEEDASDDDPDDAA